MSLIALLLYLVKLLINSQDVLSYIEDSLELPNLVNLTVYVGTVLSSLTIGECRT